MFRVMRSLSMSAREFTEEVFVPAMRQTSFHSAAVTGWTERRELLTRTIFSSFGLALQSASVTGVVTGLTVLMSTMPKRPDSSVWSG